MLTITVSSKKITDQKVNSFVFFIEQGKKITDAKLLSNAFGIDIANHIKLHDFKGKYLETCTIPVVHKDSLYHIMLVGLGEIKLKGADLIEQYRRVLGHAYKQCEHHKMETVAMQMMPASLYGITPHQFGEQSATILGMTAYVYDTLITDKDRKVKPLKEVILCVDGKDVKQVAAGVKTGSYISHAVNTARQWVNTPPSQLTPPDLAKKARAIAKETGLKLTVFDEKDIIKKGMGGLASVSRGSDVDCQFVILEYKTAKKNAPTIAFVGKGITFDSGGLSLKPPVYMETMKEDMSGAAAVIAAMEAIAHLKPDVNVVGLAPLAENLPSGKATKPGDVVTFYNGKTAEVKNTDAEGRLVLADALAYADKHFKPDAMIDLATLTGSCAHALGPFFSGLMSQDDTLVNTIEEASDRTGDRVWRLPLHDDYKKAVQSNLADLCNIGDNKYLAGSITAAHFLKHFVGDTPWAHLDIAGTAYNVPDMPYYRPGATGVGVRLLIDIARSWKK